MNLIIVFLSLSLYISFVYFKSKDHINTIKLKYNGDLNISTSFVVSEYSKFQFNDNILKFINISNITIYMNIIHIPLIIKWNETFGTTINGKFSLYINDQKIREIDLVTKTSIYICYDKYKNKYTSKKSDDLLWKHLRIKEAYSSLVISYNMNCKT